MKKSLLFAIGCALAAPALHAAPDYARVVVYHDRVGAAQTARPTVNGPTVVPGLARAATATVTVPEDNTVVETDTYYQGLRSTCLMNPGNMWADKSFANYDGLPAGTVLTEAADPANNTCYQIVTVNSAEIKNMGRFFPPRYFQSGTTVECGAWLDSAAVDDAILDAKKNERIAGTVIGSIGGAAVGAGGAELVGHTLAKDTFMQGQKALKRTDEIAFLKSKLLDKKDAERDSISKYVFAMQELRDLCKERTDGNCAEGKLRRDIADINLTEYGFENVPAANAN